MQTDELHVLGTSAPDPASTPVGTVSLHDPRSGFEPDSAERSRTESPAGDRSARAPHSASSPRGPAHTQPCERLLVSILIANCDYVRYVGEAISSALGQTYPDIEVIVIDDGSTDGSRAVIESFGDRITAIFTENLGQASAFNTAFARCRGDLICLLDSDDAFEPDKVERVVAAARQFPDAHLIHHRLSMVDEAGEALGFSFPRHLPAGDVRSVAVRAGGWFPHPVTSGLSFRRAYAERLFPVPIWYEAPPGGDQPIRVSADTYLARPAALIAPVAAIAEPLTRYRTHAGNRSRRLSSQQRLLRHKAELASLVGVMRDEFRQPVSLSVDDHLEYQLARCATRETNRAYTISRVLRTPALPLWERVREAMRVSINRGWASRR